MAGNTLENLEKSLKRAGLPRTHGMRGNDKMLDGFTLRIQPFFKPTDYLNGVQAVASRSRWNQLLPGRTGRLPTQGSQRSGCAELPHPARPVNRSHALVGQCDPCLRPQAPLSAAIALTWDRASMCPPCFPATVG